MVSIIRNQVLKHLSKFTKNLSVENIQLSALRGRCELQNLELNEDLLMELLELPSWLSLTRAFCNSAVLKVPWTKLKSDSIVITLDFVEIHVETCEQLRNVTASTRPSYTSGRYGFAEQTLDSITIVVNSVNIHLRSPAFEATLDLQRLIVDSRTPNWQKADLRHCRLKNRDSNELLLFKQIEWQTLRIEAKVSSEPSTPVIALSPLRLLTSSARCRLTLKKRLADCSLITSRLFVVFDQLLWVLTDAQLVAALHFAHSLADLIEKATDLSHKLQAGKHLSLPFDVSLGGKGLSRKETPLTAVWRAYDIAETSYHVFCTSIDLHLVDETAGGSVCRSGLPELEKGGCLQVTLKNLQIDHYPFHRACVGRDHWVRYQEPNGDRVPWLEEIHSNYAKKHNLMCAEGEYRVPLHLMCSTTLLLVDKFTVYKVSTSMRAERQPFFNNYNIASEKALFIDFTSYYYPGSSSDLAPPMPYCYANLGPNLIRLDVPTLLWSIAFVRSLLRENWFRVSGEIPTTSCRFEVYLTKVVFDEVVAQCSRMICSNSREGISSSRAELKQALDAFSRGPLFFETNKYPWSDGDLPSPPGASAVRPEIVNHCISDETSTAEVWSAFLDPIWVDFVEKGHRPEAILDPLPLTLWYCQKQILTHVRGLVNIQVCHEHFFKLLEKAKVLKLLTSQLKQDIRKSSTMPTSALGTMVAAVLPIVHVSLVLKANAGFSMAPARHEHFNSDDSARSESPPTISSSESIPAAVETVHGSPAQLPPSGFRHGGPPSVSCADTFSVSMLLGGEEALDAVSVRSDESDSLLVERFPGILDSAGGGVGISKGGRGEELLADIELAEEAAEEATEVRDDDLDALFDEEQLLSAGSDRSQTVAVVVLKVRDIQLALANKALLYQMHSIEFEENALMDREVYHAEFSARTRTLAQQNSLNKQLAATCLASGRLELEDPQRIQLLVQGLELKLSSGSIAGLADMFQGSFQAAAKNVARSSHNSNGDGRHGGPIGGPLDGLPLSARLLLYDIKVRASPGQLLVIPHCLIERPWNSGAAESPLFVLPVAFSSLDESVEKLLRHNANVAVASTVDNVHGASCAPELIGEQLTTFNSGVANITCNNSTGTTTVGGGFGVGMGIAGASGSGIIGHATLQDQHVQQLASRVQMLENDNNSLKSQSKLHKKVYGAGAWHERGFTRYMFRLVT
ncbi:UHRF1-binding protein 1-like [Tropilaelaps mercedesae]|uniref:UHRF1-binding protein 1-like n=1 Tax=Tropilaelaps mercedesae TaxID=418985 RepID=A0A1V9XPN4_9ACAR|nr:UHRF1-binding protein 1-like [Tropilaelaps mercedesae]